MSNAYVEMRKELNGQQYNPYYERSQKQFLRYLKAMNNR